MTLNAFKWLKRIDPDPVLKIGDVTFVDNGVATIELPGGGLEAARGDATIGQKVFFRDGVIEGPAPDLPIEVIEV